MRRLDGKDYDTKICNKDVDATMRGLDGKGGDITI
jgi:hypothetical protein